MPANYKQPSMSAHERYVLEAIDEIRKANDLELWEEVASKIADVLIVYRRAMRQQIDDRIRIPEDELKKLVAVYRRALEARTFTFSDGVTRDIDEMALSHATAKVAEEFGDDEANDVN